MIRALCAFSSACTLVLAAAPAASPTPRPACAPQPPPTLAQQTAVDPIEGKWFGECSFDKDRIEIGFEIKRDAEQRLKLALYEPVANYYGLELPGELSKDGAKYALAAGGFALELVGDELSGTVAPMNARLSLRRNATLPSEVPVPQVPIGPGPRWQVKLGAPIYATAALRDGVAYVGTTGGVFEAVDIARGSVLWSFGAGRALHGEALATEIALFFTCDNGWLYKLDRSDGHELWRYDLGDARVARILPHQRVFDYDYKSPRPVLEDGVLFVGSGDGSLHAVDAMRGTRVWRFESKSAAQLDAATVTSMGFVDKIRASAVVDGPRVIFGSLNGNLHALERASGKEVWKKEMRAPVTSTPAMISGKLVVGTRGAVLYALDPAVGKIDWRVLYWGGSWVESEAVERGGLLYVGSSDLRRVTCVDPTDGSVAWRSDVFGSAWGRPALTDKFVYVGVVGTEPYPVRHLGSLSALERESGKLAWRWPAPALPGSLQSGFTASAAIEGNTLVIGGLDGTLYAFPVE